MAQKYNIEEDILMACEPISDSWGGSWTEEKLDAFEKLCQCIFNNNEYFSR